MVKLLNINTLDRIYLLNAKTIKGTNNISTTEGFQIVIKLKIKNLSEVY